MATLTANIPDKLNLYLDFFVKNGWANSKEEIVLEAVSRYIDSHSEELMESQIKNDIDWGLSL